MCRKINLITKPSHFLSGGFLVEKKSMALERTVESKNSIVIPIASIFETYLATERAYIGHSRIEPCDLPQTNETGVVTSLMCPYKGGARVCHYPGGPSQLHEGLIQIDNQIYCPRLREIDPVKSRLQEVRLEQEVEK